MNQVIAAHGWAGDATVWRAWQQRFEALRLALGCH